jgi:hypothetical protein
VDAQNEQFETLDAQNEQFKTRSDAQNELFETLDKDKDLKTKMFVRTAQAWQRFWGTC